MITSELAAHAGVTYRQLDHWIRRGWVGATDPHPGPGVVREHRPADVAVCLRMAELTRCGLVPEAAHAIATGDAAAISRLSIALTSAARQAVADQRAVVPA